MMSITTELIVSVGAAAAEKWLGRRSNRDSWKPGMGAAVGFVLSVIVKVACAVVMTGLYLMAAWPALIARA